MVTQNFKNFLFLTLCNVDLNLFQVDALFRKFQNLKISIFQNSDFQKCDFQNFVTFDMNGTP
jgi:hypothetical protein